MHINFFLTETENTVDCVETGFLESRPVVKGKYN